MSGLTVAFTAATASIALTATAPLYIALYTIPTVASPTPSPSPSPTPTPSPSPSPTPVVVPDVLTFDATAPTSAPFVVTETNEYSGLYRIRSRLHDAVAKCECIAHAIAIAEQHAGVRRATRQHQRNTGTNRRCHVHGNVRITGRHMHDLGL